MKKEVDPSATAAGAAGLAEKGKKNTGPPLTRPPAPPIASQDSRSEELRDRQEPAYGPQTGRPTGGKADTRLTEASFDDYGAIANRAFARAAEERDTTAANVAAHFQRLCAAQHLACSQAITQQATEAAAALRAVKLKELLEYRARNATTDRQRSALRSRPPT